MTEIKKRFRVKAGDLVLLLFLLCMVFVYNPDFTKIQNVLWFLPLYVAIVISSTLSHNCGEDDSNRRFGIKISLFAITIIVVIFKLFIEKI